MSAQIYADDQLIYDPDLEGFEILSAKVKPSCIAAGTAEIRLPYGHPAYNSLIEFKTIIKAYRDGDLLFRGRVLLPSVDFYRDKVITCEGERCFLRDAVLEPYLYQADPAVIFSDVIRRYNSQVEEEKQFTVGEITVTDPNGYLRLESESAEYVSDVVDKLVNRVGGYIIFTSNEDGTRAINWLADLIEDDQTLDFGENLLDLITASVNPDFATVIWPYGAKDETTGKRVTIEEVNNGLRYIEDPAAIAIHGRVAAPVYWDDVTLASNLLAKARQYLAKSSQIYSSITGSAAVIGSNIRVGTKIRIKSEPHGLDAVYPVYEREYDLMDGAADRVSLGEETSTMTGGSVAGDKASQAQMRRAEQSIKTDYTISIQSAVARLRR